MSLRNTVATAMLATVIFSGGARADEFDYCLLCHGANANGNAAIRAPKLSGVEPWYLARQLEAFASGVRGGGDDYEPGHEMGPIGVRLKREGKIDDAVRFIASLESRRPPATVRADAARGKGLYAACVSCHGANGEGNGALQAPALASRTDWYLIAQLHNYRQGLRGADAEDTYGAQMRATAATLPDDQAVADVVAYINTLK